MAGGGGSMLDSVWGIALGTGSGTGVLFALMGSCSLGALSWFRDLGIRNSH